MNIEEITRLRSSLAYKHYGIPWLKDVPDHWNVPRLKTHLVLNDSGVWSEEPDDRGTTVLRSTEQTIDGHWNIKNPARLRIGERERDVATLVTGDLIITKSSGSSAHIGKTTLVDDEVSSLRCCFSNFMQRVRTGDGVRPRFLWYYLNSYIGREQLLARATTTTGLANLNGRIIGNARIPIPPPHEQYAIVRYLDDADQRIRAYVSAKERLIALLEEERQATIHQAVTRGLDPNVKLKPSGVEWLGDVPEHWQILRLGSLATKFGSGITPRGGASVYQENGIPFLRSQNIHFDGLRLTDVARISPSLHQELASSHVRPRDVLLNITGASIGRVSTVPPEFEEGNVNQHVCIIRPKQNLLLSELLSAYLSTPMMQEEIHSAQSGASREGLTLQSIRDFKVIIPPISEQKAMVKHFEIMTAKIYAAMDRARRQIELMEEYRTRLIADVVTGKIDVR